MLPSEVARQVAEALHGLRFGEVHLVVHEAQIVRIERIERIRLTATTEAVSGSIGRPTTSTEARHGQIKES